MAARNLFVVRCGCENRAGRIFRCQYHEGYLDGFEDHNNADTPVDVPFLNSDAAKYGVDETKP